MLRSIHGSDSEAVANAMLALTKAQAAAHLPEAAQTAEDLLSLSRRVFGQDAPQIGNVQTELTGFFRSAGDLQRAFDYGNAALASAERQGANSAAVANALIALCRVQAERGDLSTAIQTIERAIPIVVSVSTDDAVVGTLMSVGSDLTDDHYPRLALPVLQKAVELGPGRWNDVQHAMALQFLGTAYRDMHEWMPALDLYTQEERIWVDMGESQGILVGNTLNGRGRCLIELGEPEAAFPLLEQSLVIWRGNNPDSPIVGSILNNLAVAKQRTGDLYGAISTMQEAIDLWKRVHGPEHERVGIGLQNLASFQEKRQRYQDALMSYREALTIWEKTYGP